MSLHQQFYTSALGLSLRIQFLNNIDILINNKFIPYITHLDERLLITGRQSHSILYTRKLYMEFILNQKEKKKFSLDQGGGKVCDQIIGSTKINKLYSLESKLQCPWALSSMNDCCLMHAHEGHAQQQLPIFLFSQLNIYQSLLLRRLHTHEFPQNYLDLDTSLSLIQDITRNSTENKKMIV